MSSNNTLLDFFRIIVYLLKITAPYKYEWLDDVFKEAGTFIFFFMTGYKFRPASNNPYFALRFFFRLFSNS